MTPAMIIMIVMICIGCALGIAGLVVAGRQLLQLVKAARKAGIDSMADVQEIIRRARGLEPRMREIQEKQKVVAERLRYLSATTSKLNYLKEEFDRSTGHISKLKS
jgi:hypothetical protein